MGFSSSTSSRACLSEWNEPLKVHDILNLLLALRRAHVTAGIPVLMIVVVRETVPPPETFLLNCLKGTLPALLGCCERLAFAVEGAESSRDAFAAALRSSRQSSTQHVPIQVFDSLSSAFAYTQYFAPHDVLELQRHVLHQSFPPNRQWT